jgi:3-hydroxymyristoyl/3-hydroxydecanoyl-(acyl carrier protein) dehydratase
MKDFIPIDRIVSLEPPELRAKKGFSGREDYFEAHLPPNNPIVPGVYLLEGLCECARWLTELGSSFERTLALRGLRDAKFTRPVRPGDSVELRVRQEPSPTGASFAGECWLGAERVAAAELIADTLPVTDPAYARQRADTLRFLWQVGALEEQR